MSMTLRSDLHPWFARAGSAGAKASRMAATGSLQLAQDKFDDWMEEWRQSQDDNTRAEDPRWELVALVEKYEESASVEDVPVDRPYWEWYSSAHKSVRVVAAFPYPRDMGQEW